MEARLVVVGGDAQSRQFELRLPAVIGRSRSTDVRLGHPLVSRHHCEVFEADGILMVRDLGSLNGTFVGDSRLTEQAMPIQPGEVFTVGPVALRAEYTCVAKPNGRSSTWDTQGATFDDPLPPGNGHQSGGSNGDSHKRLFGDDDEDTARPSG